MTARPQDGDIHQRLPLVHNCDCGDREDPGSRLPDPCRIQTPDHQERGQARIDHQEGGFEAEDQKAKANSRRDGLDAAGWVVTMRSPGESRRTSWISIEKHRTPPPKLGVAQDCCHRDPGADCCHEPVHPCPIGSLEQPDEELAGAVDGCMEQQQISTLPRVRRYIAVNTKVEANTAGASCHGIMSVTNNGKCHSVHTMPRPVLATSGDWLCHVDGRAYPRQPGSSTRLTTESQQRSALAVPINDHPASWAADGAAAPNKTFR